MSLPYAIMYKKEQVNVVVDALAMISILNARYIIVTMVGSSVSFNYSFVYGDNCSSK